MVNTVEFPAQIETQDDVGNSLLSDLKTLLTDLKTANAAAVAHLATSDAQMTNLIAAFGSVVLDTGGAIIGKVGVLGADGATIASSTNPSVVRTGITKASVDKGGAITTGGTQQTLAAAKADRTVLAVQNLDAAVDLWVNELGNAAADQHSIKLGPGQLYEWPSNAVPGTAISVYSSKTGHLFYAREA